jgi:sterol desaturase/sphingolipid hydroxylase (fatty acid hydroxylase superfamily)
MSQAKTQATHYKIDYSDVPIRLFKSDFLEFFTHITPQAIVVIWTPVIALFMLRAFQESALVGSALYILPAYVLGLFIWTFGEYTMHRFVFHFPPRTPTMERITFLFHGVHHAQPSLKTRLVMPPVVSIPLAIFFYGLFSLLFGWLRLPLWIAPTLGGTVTGYLIYDLTHYATHHWPIKGGYFKFLKKYHMLHHFKTEDARFGVTSPIWDYVFKTMPAE